MRNIIVVIIAGTFAAAPLAMAEVNTNKAFSMRLYGFVEQFEWKEFIDGQEVLEESGPLFGVGGELGLRLTDPFWLEGRGEMFLGDVDYDGAIVIDEGVLVPYKSTTKYVGVKIEGYMALRLRLDRNVHVKPYAGLGLREWRRTLDTGLSDEYIGEFGYIENWLTVYGLVGCAGEITVNKNGLLFGRIEGRFALSNSMIVDLRNQGGPSDIEMDPGKRPSVYVEGGLILAPITASIFVETLDFSESPLDDKYQAVFQPESKSTMIGAKFGLAF